MDLAKKENAGLWLRHPVLGDPSFDSFEKLGTVHRSEPPYEWAVNDSLFRDPADGAWYCYVGCYPRSYMSSVTRSRCLVYRSRDNGANWQLLGPVFPDEPFRFEGVPSPATDWPDMVLQYDPRRKNYLLTYDWAARAAAQGSQQARFDEQVDSGFAVAWADSPAGPFERARRPAGLNSRLRGRLGRFNRLYATTVLPREKDYLALVLCDSGPHFAWGLAAMTAAEPDGDWSDPVLLLSCDRPGYYPTPVEFYPAMLQDGTVWAPCTSVAKNRSYQALFRAPLERAHDPSAWTLAADGNLWHSRPEPDEAGGIWGQTLNGFVQDGRLTVVYPTLDERGCGVIQTAQRPAGQPLHDGFVFSGHGGPSVTVTLAAWHTFELDAGFDAVGTVEFAFDCAGTLGPDVNAADSSPAASALGSLCAVQVCGTHWKLLRRAEEQTVLAEGEAAGPIGSLTLERGESEVVLRLRGEQVCRVFLPAPAGMHALGLIAGPRSALSCSRFEVRGGAGRYEQRWNAFEALLGAGQDRAEWQAFDTPSGPAFLGGPGAEAKWNVMCDELEIEFPQPSGAQPQAAAGSRVGIWIDGALYGAPDPARTPRWHAVIASGMGRHGIRLRAQCGSLPLGRLTVWGPVCRGPGGTADFG